jgi:hypothetical protein
MTWQYRYDKLSFAVEIIPGKQQHFCEAGDKFSI